MEKIMEKQFLQRSGRASDKSGDPLTLARGEEEIRETQHLRRYRVLAEAHHARHFVKGEA
jgi:hypothetical protein